MKRYFFLFTTLVMTAVVIAGCTGYQSDPAVTAIPTNNPANNPAPTDSIQPFTGLWTLTVMGTGGGTTAVTPTATVTLDIHNNGTLQGYDGCRNYFATYTATGSDTGFGHGIIISPSLYTNITCEGISEQENDYFSILADTSAFSGDDLHLTLTGKTHDTLAFHRPWVVPTDTTLPQYP